MIQGTSLEAERSSEAEDDENDFVSLLASLTNYIHNERVRAFNQGFDAGRASSSASDDRSETAESADGSVKINPPVTP